VVEPAHETNLDQSFSQRCFGFDDRERTVRVGGQRLFAENRLARFEAGKNLLLMGRARGCENNGVDVLGCDGIERIDDDARPWRQCCDFLGAGERVVVDDGDADRRFCW